MMNDTEVLTKMVQEQRKALVWLIADAKAKQLNPGNYSKQLKHAIEICDVTEDV